MAAQAGKAVFDPLSWRGTTQFAAQRARRRCIWIEISLANADFAIRRWELVLAREAVHRETGESFATRDTDHPTGICVGTTTGTITE